MTVASQFLKHQNIDPVLLTFFKFLVLVEIYYLSEFLEPFWKDIVIIMQVGLFRNFIFNLKHSNLVEEIKEIVEARVGKVT